MRTNAIETGKYVVLLIGASRYDTNKYSDILNVEANIEQMKNIFLDKRFIGVREKNLFISLNEDSKAVEHQITDACRAAKNSDYTLFVYYSGHGIINPDNYKLYFATSTMDVNYLDSEAIEAKTILDKISRSAAARKIFVVDACHSGGIHNTMGDTTEASLMKNYEGVHYVSACDEDSTALFNKRKPDEPTYFTGALVNRIKHGMDISSPELTLREIVDDIASDFRGKNLPTPQQSCMLNVDRMPFAHNIRGKKISCSNNDNGKKFEYSTASTNVIEIPDYKTINNDNKMWEIACSINTIAKYNDYVTVFPKGIHVKEANSRIEALKQKMAKKKSIIVSIAAVMLGALIIASPGNSNQSDSEDVAPLKIDTIDTSANNNTKVHDNAAIVNRVEYTKYDEETKADTLATKGAEYWKVAIKIYDEFLDQTADKKAKTRVKAKINDLQAKIDAYCAEPLSKAYLNAKSINTPICNKNAKESMAKVYNVTNRPEYEEFYDLINEGNQKALSNWMEAHPLN